MDGYETMSTKIWWNWANSTHTEYNTYMSASMDNTSIADLGSVSTGWLNVNGLGVGETFWSWSYGFSREWDDGYDCQWAYEDRTDSMPTQVKPTPHHLKVGNDLFGSTSCNGVRRVIDYVVVDLPGTHPVGDILVIEDMISGSGVTVHHKLHWHR